MKKFSGGNDNFMTYLPQPKLVLYFSLFTIY